MDWETFQNSRQHLLIGSIQSGLSLGITQMLKILNFVGQALTSLLKNIPTRNLSFLSEFATFN